MSKNKGLDRYDIKIANRKMILEILEEGNCLSRVQLARYTEMSATSMTRIINELLSLNLLLETDGICVGKGRRSTILSVNPDAFLVVGMFFDRHSLKFCIMNFKMQVLCTAEYPHSLHHSPMSAQEAADVCGSLYDIFLHNEAKAFDRFQIMYAGVSFPGPVDTVAQVVIDSPSFQFSDLENLVPALARSFGVPVYMENDVRASLVNEYCRYERHRGDSVAFLTIGDGLGCSLMYHGELLRGIRSVAGEVAHVLYPSENNDAECDKKFSSFMLLSHTQLKNLEKIGIDLSDVSVLLRAVEARNPVAVEAVSECSIKLACLLNLIICMYNPEKIILGGSLIHRVPHIVDLAKSHEKLFFADSLTSTEIDISSETIGEELAGAAVLAVKEYRTRLLENVCSGDCTTAN